jgi:hypothetical protein
VTSIPATLVLLAGKLTDLSLGAQTLDIIIEPASPRLRATSAQVWDSR